ncbi:LysR substrate-binding domain-containing protein [Aureimonas psammosilenae]|uniref:LysR substrate-binding domain-containing protein n=1 Tax=Aureimonas psammosilenae TaxID=2495496 RepID=UPI001260A567|nr:LysR substrate-binding domain-containing protein [Aureimonas psammosilenae]
MAVARRFLPSMSLLRAFEAAARLQSFTAAGAEINLTQSAVSRQIRALEELLGAELFVRERQSVRLTVAGEAYAREVREALGRIAGATLAFRANPGGGTLNLAILPTFGTRWLAPRLPAFLKLHPGITFNLTTRLSPFDFRLEALDAAIHFGAADWPGAELDLLMSETVVPACSPQLAERFGFGQPADLLAAPLLHLASRPDAWERWFDLQKASPGPLRGMLFDQFATAAQAAVSNLGVALLPEFLIEDDIRRGDLVRALPLPMESTERYYLACSVTRTSYPPLAAFRRWIREEASNPTLQG